jgi:hypothetical protein
LEEREYHLQTGLKVLGGSKRRCKMNRPGTDHPGAGMIISFKPKL